MFMFSPRASYELSLCEQCLTFNYTAISRLIPSCGVYSGLRQPLSFFTALICLTLAKTALRHLRPVLGAFCWPWAAFASLYWFYTDTSSIIYLCRV